MRSFVMALVVAAALGAGSAANAAPTCQTQNGDGIRCGTPGAMPVGWTLPHQDYLALHPSETTDPKAILEAFCVLGVFFALMALLPEFDGRTDAEWGRQEDDAEPRLKPASVRKDKDRTRRR